MQKITKIALLFSIILTVAACTAAYTAQSDVELENRANTESYAENAVLTETYEELYSMIQRQIKEQQYDGACQTLQKAKQIESQDAEPWLIEARLCLQLGQAEMAAAQIKDMPEVADKDMAECSLLLEAVMKQIWDQGFIDRQIYMDQAGMLPSVAEALLIRMQYYPNDGVRNLIKIYQRAQDDNHRWAALNAVQQYYERFARFSDDQDKEMIQLFQQASTVPEIIAADGVSCPLPVWKDQYWYQASEEEPIIYFPAALGSRCEIREKTEEIEIWDTELSAVQVCLREGSLYAAEGIDERWEQWLGAQEKVK